MATDCRQKYPQAPSGKGLVAGAIGIRCRDRPDVHGRDRTGKTQPEFARDGTNCGRTRVPAGRFTSKVSRSRARIRIDRMVKLRFLDLNTRHPGISPGLSLSFSEAARVCLDRHHVSPCEFKLQDNDKNTSANAEWDQCDERLRAAWANRDDATRDGAYGIAIAAIETLRNLVAVGRAETRTGADYYLSESSNVPGDLENTIRLEVSGTDEGGNSIINARLREKLDQAKKGNSNLPAIASVVGFSARRVVSADLEQE